MHSYNDNALHSTLSTQKIDSSHPREEKATWEEESLKNFDKAWEKAFGIDSRIRPGTANFFSL